MLQKMNIFNNIVVKAPDIHSRYFRPIYDAVKYYSRSIQSQRTMPLENDIEKVIKVSIMGVPNSGKSTLINNLMNRKVCPASCKTHTTKTKARALCVVDNTQIVFMDTPGVISPGDKKKFKLSDTMMSDLKICLEDSDVIGVLHDVGTVWTRDFIHKGILDLLENYNKVPHFLILNKIDMMKSKRKLLDHARILCNNRVSGNPISKYEPKENKGYSGFSDVFMISALEGDGTDSIKDYLVKNAKPGKWLFPEEKWSDQAHETLVLQSVRAKFLDYLPRELPYKLSLEMDYFEEFDDKINCLISVVCPTNRLMKVVAGGNDGKLQRISDSARFDLMDMFKKTINLTISLKLPFHPRNVEV